MKHLIALIVGLAAPVAAQDLRYADTATLTCLSEVPPAQRTGCIGQSANLCMAATSDGSTTVGMGYCLEQELRFWDNRLNAHYGDIRARARAADEEMAQIGANAPQIGPALRDMQTAWIAYRDATCDFERAQWGGGTGGGPATYACLMRITGTQALYLSSAWLGE